MIINGPNLNLTGIREPNFYGTKTMEAILDDVRQRFAAVAKVDYFQSNSEGEIIDKLHDAALGGGVDGVVLNAGALTHTSLALADAIASVDRLLPVVEIHFSNIASREPIRRQSLIAPVCVGSISGFGAESYALGVEALVNHINQKMKNHLTEIMATVANNRCNKTFVEGLIDCGASHFRINSAHVDPEQFREMVDTIRQCAPFGSILTDTKGPEIRTTDIENSMVALEVSKGDEFILEAASASSGLTRAGHIVVNYDRIAEKVAKGIKVLFDDGELEMEVVSGDGEQPRLKALNDGLLGCRKSLSIPGADISDLPAVTERDRRSLETAARLGVDIVAHSFVRSADDVKAVRKVLADAGGENVLLFSKIECRQGLEHFSEILEASDGILVARGDLGMEVNVELIPALQREIVKRTHEAGKPVIVATQFLQSMINSPRPTRAEITDIEQAVAQGTETLLLCGETAAGNYPLEAVATMRKAIYATGINVDDMLR